MHFSRERAGGLRSTCRAVLGPPQPEFFFDTRICSGRGGNHICAGEDDFFGNREREWVQWGALRGVGGLAPTGMKKAYTREVRGWWCWVLWYLAWGIYRPWHPGNQVARTRLEPWNLMRVFSPPAVLPQIKKMKILCSKAKYNSCRGEKHANFFRTLQWIWVVRREFGFPTITSSILHTLVELKLREGLEDRGQGHGVAQRRHPGISDRLSLHRGRPFCALQGI